MCKFQPSLLWWTIHCKIRYFSGYVVKGISQKRDQFLIVQSDIMRNILNRIFHVRNNRVNRNAEKCHWLCSSGLIRIKAGRIPAYKTTYFKDVKVLFDGVNEVNCIRNIMLMCKFTREKCYYLKIIDLFREISNWLKKIMELENFKLLFKSKTFLEDKYQHERLYRVSDNIWLEILQNQKGIYVSCKTTELLMHLVT